MALKPILMDCCYYLLVCVLLLYLIKTFFQTMMGQSNISGYILFNLINQSVDRVVHILLSIIVYPLSTNIQVVFVKVTLHKIINVCSMY